MTLVLGAVKSIFTGRQGKGIFRLGNRNAIPHFDFAAPGNQEGIIYKTQRQFDVPPKEWQLEVFHASGRLWADGKPLEARGSGTSGSLSLFRVIIPDTLNPPNPDNLSFGQLFGDEPLPPPKLEFSIEIAGPEVLNFNQIGTFFVKTISGVEPFQYLWKVDGKIVSDLNLIDVDFTTSGTHTISLKVTDAIGETKTASLIITVLPPEPTPLPPPEPEPGPDEGLSLDTKIGLAVLGIGSVIGVVFGAILAQKPKK